MNHFIRPLLFKNDRHMATGKNAKISQEIAFP